MFGLNMNFIVFGLDLATSGMREFTPVHRFKIKFLAHQRKTSLLIQDELLKNFTKDFLSRLSHLFPRNTHLYAIAFGQL